MENENENENVCYCYNPVCRNNGVCIKNNDDANAVGSLWLNIKNNTTDRKVFNEFKKDFGFYKSPTELYSNQEVEATIESRKQTLYQQKILYADCVGDSWKQELQASVKIENCSICNDEDGYMNTDDIQSNNRCKNYQEHIKNLLELVDEYEVLDDGELPKLLRDLKSNKSCKNVLKWVIYYSKKDSIQTFDMLRDTIAVQNVALKRAKNPIILENMKKCIVRNINSVGLNRDNSFDFYWKDLVKNLKTNNMNNAKYK